MRAVLKVLIAVALLVASALPAYVQAPPGAPPAATPTVNLTAEQRHVIKENVKDMKIDRAPESTRAAIGSDAPSGVPLQTFPPIVLDKVPQIKSHSFFVKGDQIVIVDPKDHKVADIIE